VQASAGCQGRSPSLRLGSVTVGTARDLSALQRLWAEPAARAGGKLVDSSSLGIALPLQGGATVKQAIINWGWALGQRSLILRQMLKLGGHSVLRSTYRASLPKYEYVCFALGQPGPEQTSEGHPEGEECAQVVLP